MAVETEASILASIPDFDDATDTNTNDTTTETTQTNDADTTGAGTGLDAPSSEGSTTDAPAQPSAEPAATVRRDGLVEKPNAADPRARDLVDPATGQVVARGGIERRIFEGAQRMQRDNVALQARVTAAEANANNASEIVKLGTTLQLQPQDQANALTIMSQFLKDPVKTLEALVVEVKSKGYPIPFLETGVTAGMDTAAIQRMMDQKLAPITDARKQQEQATETQAQAKRTLDTFLDQNPEGQHNLTVLAEMITVQPGMTIDQAYTKMIQYCARNGLDYSQPLKPQIEARQTKQPATTTAQTPDQPRSPAAPLPNGRMTNGAVPVAQAASFDENSSWSDILRHSMRETGFAQ